jgi:hypothetical protein
MPAATKMPTATNMTTTAAATTAAAVTTWGSGSSNKTRRGQPDSQKYSCSHSHNDLAV